MRRIAVVVCLIALAFAACGKNDSPTVNDSLPTPTAINLAPAEKADGTYGFDNVPAAVTVDGVAAITLKNTGKEAHQAALIKLADGASLDQALAFFSSEGAPSGPPPFSVAGGTTVVSPASSVTVTQTLPAGSYAFLCFVPSADGAPHFVKGMIAAITVSGVSTTTLPLPDGENSTAKEYGYNLPALKAGETTLRVRNTGAQDHEYQIGALQDGKTADDALAWLKSPQGPPPFAFVGGPVIGRGGGANSVNLDLKKGTYVFFCQIPDDVDGKPHFEHGMFQGVSVT